MPSQNIWTLYSSQKLWQLFSCNSGYFWSEILQSMSKFLLLNLGGFSSTIWAEFFWLQDKSLTLVTSSPKWATQLEVLLIRAITFKKFHANNKIPYRLKFHKSEFIINHKNIHSCSETILSHHHHTDREPRIQQVSAVTLPWVMVTWGSQVSKGGTQK